MRRHFIDASEENIQICKCNVFLQKACSHNDFRTLLVRDINLSRCVLLVGITHARFVQLKQSRDHLSSKQLKVCFD